MAAFTVTGVAVAISTGADPLWMWGPLLIRLTAAGGGILRDLLRQRGEIASLHGAFYGEVPIVWGLLLSVFLLWQGIDLEPEKLGMAVAATVVGALATRLIVVVRGIAAWASPRSRAERSRGRILPLATCFPSVLATPTSLERICLKWGLPDPKGDKFSHY